MSNSNDNKISIFPFFDEYPNMFVKQTISSLFKTLLETVMDVRTESVVIFKNTSLENIDSVLTRLSFSNAKIFSFSNNSKYNNFEILDDAADIFDEDFLLIFSERFSVVLAFIPTETKGFLEGCTSLNSSIVNKILETLKQNEAYDKVIEAINQFNLDRRGNIMFDTILNKLLLRVEDSQRDLLCANDENGVNSVLEEKDLKNILRNYSHELRNPVGMLGVYGKILSGHVEKIKNNDGNKESFEAVEKASSVIVNTIEHIENTLSEMSNHAEEFTLNLAEENLNTLVENVIDFARPSFNQKNVTLLYEDKCPGINLEIDKHKIYQVLLNLLKNALEATGEGKTVTVVLDKVDNEAIINIKDEGKGIPHDVVPKIFRAYFTTKESGSGIGLNLSKKIIEKHNGDLTLISNSENGCEFQINLK